MAEARAAACAAPACWLCEGARAGACAARHPTLASSPATPAGPRPPRVCAAPARPPALPRRLGGRPVRLPGGRGLPSAGAVSMCARLQWAGLRCPWAVHALPSLAHGPPIRPCVGPPTRPPPQEARLEEAQEALAAGTLCGTRQLDMAELLAAEAEAEARAQNAAVAAAAAAGVS